MADEGFRFPVDLTAIMLFASAIGETNPIYYDEDYAAKTPLEGVVAPPTFAIASAHWDPDYFLRGIRRIPAPKPKPAPKAVSGGAAGGGGGGGEPHARPARRAALHLSQADAAGHAPQRHAAAR